MFVDEKNEQFKFEADLLTQKASASAPLAHPIIISRSYDETIGNLVTLKQLIQDSKDVVKCRFAVNQFVPETFQVHDFVKAYNSKSGNFRDV